MTKIKTALLITAAEELQLIGEFEPAVDTKVPPDELETLVKEAALFLTPDDELTDETFKVLQELFVNSEDELGKKGIVGDGKIKIPVLQVFQELGILKDSEELEDPTEGKFEEAEEVQTEEEKQEGDDLFSEVKSAERLKDLRDIAKSNDEFKGIRGQLSRYKTTKELRMVMLGVLREESKQVKEEKFEKTEKEKSPDVKDYSKSNKALVYFAWKNGETDCEKLLKIVDGRVKKTTIISWTRQWSKGKALPAIAKSK